MGFQTLYRAKAFGAGSDLWIVPDPEESEIASRIDWYLNFQIAKSKVHETQKISAHLEASIKTHALVLPQISKEDGAPLLIASEQRFPNRMVVEMKVSAKPKVWVDEIQKLWAKLDRPRLRVFLPRDMTPEDFQNEWQAPMNPSDEITLVPPA